MSSKRLRRRSKRVPRGDQPAFGFAGAVDTRSAPVPGRIPADPFAAFHDPDPAKLAIGPMLLGEFLRQVGFDWVIDLRLWIRELDLRPFLESYAGTGRKPFHPAAMLGLIIYGLLVGKSSLRGLAELAAGDLRAMWMTGGLIPDHSTIGKFIQMHAEFLTEEFFVTTTRQLMKKLGVRAREAAGDGTAVEAAASHWRTIKAEAAREAAQEAAAAAAAAPDDPEAKAAAEAATQVERTINERVARAEAMRHSSAGIRVSPKEPEAVVQPVKSGVVRPSYKPTVLANPERLIVGQHVEPSDEAAAIPALVEQHKSILGAAPQTTLLDAGFHDIDTLAFFVQGEMDVLCPSGTARGKDDFKKEAQKPFSKSHFLFEEQTDRYICPLGKPLERHSQGHESPSGQAFTRYRGTECSGCPRRAECTKSAARTVKRYDGEELKEAADHVLEHPAARAKYRQRKAMVEPVFAELKYRQGLVRFRRRGLRGVRLEFALHCVAYNFKRGISLHRRLIIAILFLRFPGKPWSPVMLAVALA